MKKILLLAIAAFSVACSSDDDAQSAPIGETYIDTTTASKTCTVLVECDGALKGTYCISNATYNQILDYIITNPGNCDFITFEDIDGVEITGYFSGLSENNTMGCVRKTNP